MQDIEMREKKMENLTGAEKLVLSFVTKEINDILTIKPSRIFAIQIIIFKTL